MASPRKDAAPWERQPGESEKAFQAFVIYRDLGPLVRSVRRVRETIDKIASDAAEVGQEAVKSGPLSRLLIWSSKYSWVDRAEAWDAELDREFRDERLRSVRRMARSHDRLGRLILSKVRARFVAMTDEEARCLTPYQACRMAEAGAKLHRNAFGKQGDEEKETEAPKAGDSWEEMLAKLTPEQLERFEGMMNEFFGNAPETPAAA